MNKGSAGGKVMAIRQRKDALDRYYSKPNICLFCDRIIEVKDNERVPDIRKRKFCNHCCSASYYNVRREKKKKDSKKLCPVCNKELVRIISEMCRKCRQKENSVDNVGCFTKGEFFAKRKGYQSGRSSIRRHAQKIYLSSDKPKKCFVCGYDRYFEVCHIKKVSKFSKDVLISVINSIDNLVALCPTHHWEFDHGFIKL